MSQHASRPFHFRPEPLHALPAGPEAAESETLSVAMRPTCRGTGQWREEVRRPGGDSGEAARVENQAEPCGPRQTMRAGPEGTSRQSW